MLLNKYIFHSYWPFIKKSGGYRSFSINYSTFHKFNFKTGLQDLKPYYVLILNQPTLLRINQMKWRAWGLSSSEKCIRRPDHTGKSLLFPPHQLGLFLVGSASTFLLCHFLVVNSYARRKRWNGSGMYQQPGFGSAKSWYESARLRLWTFFSSIIIRQTRTFLFSCSYLSLDFLASS